MSKSSLLSKNVVVGIALLTMLYLLPFLSGGISGAFLFESLFSNSDDFTSSLIRSVVFAVVSTSINVLIGLLVAVLLSKIAFFSVLGKQLSFFLLPTTLGNIATAYVFKLILFNTSFFNFVVQGSNIEKFALLSFLQFWQYGILFTYLFWLNIQNIPKQKIDYGKAIQLSSVERIKDIVLPSSKNLAILLLLIGFIFSFYEDAKNQFIFRASQGTQTELINHWLERTYQSQLVYNPNYAVLKIFETSFLVFLITIIIFGLIGFFANTLFKLFSSSKSILIKSNQEIIITKSKTLFSKAIALTLMLFVFVPLFIAITKSNFSFTYQMKELLSPLLLTLTAALGATLLAVIFGVSSRLSFPKILSDFNNKSAIYFTFTFLLQLVPPICVLLCGFKWMSWLGYNNSFLIYFVWVLAHTILLLPILGSFIITTHFRVKENEFQYMKGYAIPILNILRFSFIRRFRAEYLLTLIIAFSLIWNEAIINIVLSDSIPSFASNLQMLFIGRAADYTKASAYLLVALSLSIASVLTWQYILNKAQSLKQA